MYTPDICIYHGGCDDGFTAAWAIWKRWPNCVFIPGYYGKPLPDVEGKHVLFVDFSAKQDAMRKFAATALSVIVIDHHKTAQAELVPWTIGIGAGETPSIELLLARLTDPAASYDVPVVAWFDMEQSGAMMTWKFAFPHRAIPTFVRFIQDRDLWKFDYGDQTRRFSAALRTYPMDFEKWDWLALGRGWDNLEKDGEAILRAHNANIDKFIVEVYDELIGEHVVPVVNVPYYYASDTAHAMLQKYPHAPFAACWFHRADGMVQWSLRSEDSRVDVSEVAKAFGGGGHRNAAGFQEKAK